MRLRPISTCAWLGNSKALKRILQILRSAHPEHFFVIIYGGKQNIYCLIAHQCMGGGGGWLSQNMFRGLLCPIQKQ